VLGEKLGTRVKKTARRAKKSCGVRINRASGGFKEMNRALLTRGPGWSGGGWASTRGCGRVCNARWRGAGLGAGSARAGLAGVARELGRAALALGWAAGLARWAAAARGLGRARAGPREGEGWRGGGGGTGSKAGTRWAERGELG
jgi:hypothetical protein